MKLLLTQCNCEADKTVCYDHEQVEWNWFCVFEWKHVFLLFLRINSVMLSFPGFVLWSTETLCRHHWPEHSVCLRGNVFSNTSRCTDRCQTKGKTQQSLFVRCSAISGCQDCFSATRHWVSSSESPIHVLLCWERMMEKIMSYDSHHFRTHQPIQDRLAVKTA